jgi:hypothetical protein
VEPPREANRGAAASPEQGRGAVAVAVAVAAAAAAVVVVVVETELSGANRMVGEPPGRPPIVPDNDKEGAAVAEPAGPVPVPALRAGAVAVSPSLVRSLSARWRTMKHVPHSLSLLSLSLSLSLAPATTTTTTTTSC